MFLQACCLLTIGLVPRSDAEFSRNVTENSLSVVEKFEAFIRKYNKIYSSEMEKMMRFERFQKSLEEIDRLQKDDTGTATYAINQFSDLSREEFLGGCGKSFYQERLMEKDNCKVLDTPNGDNEFYGTNKPPSTLDWRDTGKVGPIRDQGFRCGACYAFAAVGVFDIVYSVKHNRQYTFSVQQIIDCTFGEGKGFNHGCDGGHPAATFRYINDTGLAEDEYLPYFQRKNPCEVSPSLELHSFGSVESHIKGILQFSPTTAAVNFAGFQHYEGGIMRLSNKECKQKHFPDVHHVMIIGYGSETKKVKNKDKEYPYWIVRNGQGITWGEDGYARVYRGENVCGIGNFLDWVEVDIGKVF